MRILYTHPRLIVAVTVFITLFFAFQLPRAELENNNLRFVPSDDPALETSKWIDSTFGSSFFILVGLERQYGTVFDREFLNRIREYTRTIEEISVVKEVSSLLSADYITSDGDAIVVEKLVGDDFSGSPEEIAELKRRLLSWDMYDRALFSDDFTATQILIPLTIQSDEAASKEINKQFIQIRDIARETFSDIAGVYVTGMPVIAATVNEAMNADLKLLVPLVVLVVLAVLFFSFRGLTPVVLPLLTVLIATVWSVGAMPLCGVKLSVISTVLPVILVAVGSAYGIHIVTHYLTERSTTALSRDEHRELVLSVVMKIRKPVFLAALTTFVAFVSFCFTPVAPCREFGYFASFGVAAAFAVAITFIPALLIIRGPRKEKIHADREDDNTGMSVFIADNLVNIARYKKTIFFCTILIGVVSIYGLSKLVIDNIMVEYFRADTDIYRSDSFIRRQFGGSKVASIVLEADSPDIILRPDTLAALDGLSDYLQRKVVNVGKVMGFTDLVKRINQVFNANESPEGLQPARAVTQTDNSFGFGFDDADYPAADFGFGGFGFDDSADYPADVPPPTEQSQKVFTQNEMLALFDRAGNASRGMSAGDLIRELKRQVNYEGASYYEIPLNPQRYGKETPDDLRRLIANYLVLLSGNISSYANDPLEPTAIKAIIQLRTTGMNDSQSIFREIEQYAAANFPPDVKVTLGGTTMVEKSLNDLVVQSQLVSVIFSIICVFIIITLSNKSLAAGCIGIAPLSISVLINFAVMGFAGIKLNLGTSMVASVSVGVGIDYTIHCLEAYKREYRASNGAGNFLWRAFISSGKAIIINAVSVGAGFAVLFFSRFNMLADLGLLIAITMFSSALISLTVLPAMLAVFKPKFVTG
ncbi:MAG: MMPL family transporter [Treponema sp.]|jgi:predicted RND superfamily exporter protein|nr:MMPL family transporter [Treponema sp.]